MEDSRKEDGIVMCTHFIRKYDKQPVSIFNLSLTMLAIDTFLTHFVLSLCHVLP